MWWEIKTDIVLTAVASEPPCVVRTIKGQYDILVHETRVLQLLYWDHPRHGPIEYSLLAVFETR